MDKMIYRLKGSFPGKMEKNIHVIDMDAGTFEYKEFCYNESSCKGKIWVDGIEIKPYRAMELRKDFSDGSLNFTWGYSSHPTRITALSICLHIFKEDEIALNMYLPFMNKYLIDKRESFEKEIDLTDFVIDHRDRLQSDYFTRYFDFNYILGGMK